MSSEMFGEIAGSEQFMEEFMTSIGSSLLSSTWSFLLSLVAYIFMAVGMYTIANRRGIKHAWLAWIPFGSTWLLGCISDQYRYVAMGQEKSKRKVLLGLEIAVSIAGTAVIVLIVAALVKMFGFVDMQTGELINGSVNEAMLMSEVMPPLMIALLLGFVMMGISIAYAVLYYWALHDLFKSCAPENATMFLVLGIFLGEILMSLFVFAGRKKDLGMLPRQDQVMYAQPVFQPQQPPVYQPPQPPVYQPPQPPVEPWEQNQE
jgi:hypothetical protein